MTGGGGGRRATAVSPPEELLAVGRVTRAHGIRGEVAVLPLTEVSARFEPGSVLLVGPEGERRLTVRSARPHGGRVLVRFREVTERDAAERLRGAVLLVPAGDVPPLDEEGRFWVHQLTGLEVRTEDGRTLGRIREVLHNPANDIWVVDGDGGEVLVPALRGVVMEVDLAARRVVVRDDLGLLEGWEDA